MEWIVGIVGAILLFSAFDSAANNLPSSIRITAIIIGTVLVIAALVYDFFNIVWKKR